MSKTPKAPKPSLEPTHGIGADAFQTAAAKIAAKAKPAAEIPRRDIHGSVVISPADIAASTLPADHRPPGETGRELTGDEAAAALAGHVSAPAASEVFSRRPKTTPCPDCGGTGAVVVGHGKTRCARCHGAGELSV